MHREARFVSRCRFYTGEGGPTEKTTGNANYLSEREEDPGATILEPVISVGSEAGLTRRGAGVVDEVETGPSALTTPTGPLDPSTWLLPPSDSAECCLLPVDCEVCDSHRRVAFLWIPDPDPPLAAGWWPVAPTPPPSPSNDVLWKTFTHMYARPVYVYVCTHNSYIWVAKLVYRFRKLV